MRKYLLLWVAVWALAFGGSSALGASLDAMGVLPNYVPPSGGGQQNCTASQALGLSPDGKVAVGYTYGQITWDGVPYAASHIPVYWSKTTGMVRRNTQWRDGDWTGIGSSAGGTPGPNYHATMAGNLSGIGKYVSTTIGSDYPYQPDTIKNLPPVSNTLTAGTNSVSGSDRWIAGYYNKLGQTYTGYAMRWDETNINNPVYRQGSGATAFRGVANSGACVGQDKHGTGGTTDGAIYWDGASAGVTNIPALAGNVATRGQGVGISDNGLYTTGYLYNDSGSPGLYSAFKWSPGQASSTELGHYGNDTLSWGGDAADDGMVAGWTYNPTNSYRACVWDNDGTPQILWDFLVSQGVDMSYWSKLTRAYSITPDGMYVSGYGLTAAGREEGFVAFIPEPATMLLLALGGLALRRRR